MKIINETKIKYTFVNKQNEKSYMTFNIEQIEGSVPNFYEQIQDILGKDVKIIEREILEEKS